MEETLPESLLVDLLGSRKRILFVEGTEADSLDAPLYNVLFPNLTIIAKGSSVNVCQAVRGLQENKQYHRVESFGLIDHDGHTEETITRLEEENIFVLPVYSVESLYYCSESMAAVAQRQAESLDGDWLEMLQNAKRGALNVLDDPEVAKWMASRRSEQRFWNRALTNLPKWKCIKEDPCPKIDFSVHNPYLEELEKFKQLQQDGDFDSLVARFPLRHSKAFGIISAALELKKQDKQQDTYKRTLIAQLRNDVQLAAKLKQRLGRLAQALDGQSTLSSA